MESSVLFQQLGLSVLLGLLVGLQREHAQRGRPGMRTFPLVTVFGTVSAVLGLEFGGWVVAAGLIALVVTMALPHLLERRDKDTDRGTTTDMAVLTMFGVGALMVVAPVAVAVAIGGGVAVLLQYKPEMHRFANRLGDVDLKAIMQFVLITCIILPVLPNETYGPLDVLNPFKTWLMVVLIVGMSLGGYILYKFLGRDAGILLGGVLGGAISSTATTVSYARQARGNPMATRVASIVIMVASTVVFLRVLVEIAVVSPRMLTHAVGPICVLMVLVLVPALAVWYRVRKQPNEMPEQENPTQLKSAVAFGLMYAVVLFALAAARQYAGEQGLVVVAGLSGLTDMDAITLSTAEMANTDADIAAEGWRLIIIASLANLVFKAMLAGVLGGWRLLLRISALFTIPLAGGVLMLFFWPW